jgi:arylsulfatase A-like enzyme/Tfp pilus assembly protein PilF
VILALLLALSAAPAAPNVLLVTIDTLRADRVGAYGHAAAATPTLDRLAREGVLVEEAVVQVPQTRPSHASILTGLLPYEHGIRDNSSPPLPARFATLATVLKAQGYATGAAVGAYPVSRASGLDRGFDVFDDPFGSGESATARNPRTERNAAEVVDAALRFLARPRQAPFFLWVHLFDPHHPYEAPAPYRARFRAQPYDGEVAYTDAQLGRLFARLREQGALDRTLVVVTADHGEGLGDHGEDEHLLFVYDSTLRVPLLMRLPGKLPAGARVRGQFRSVDLMPTILELAGRPPVRTSGLSRAAQLATGSAIPANESYAESLYGSLHFGWAPLRALRAEGWKYIDAPRPELYRLAEDPGEARNRMADRATVAGAMKQRLATLDSGVPRPPAPTLDAGAAERLAALGYIGGSFFQGAPSGADPKDKLAEFQGHRRAFQEALRLFRRRDLDGAIRILTKLAAPQTENGQVVERRSFNVEYYLGRSLLEKRRYAEATAHLARASALAPDSVPAAVFLAQAQAAGGRPKDALATLSRALQAFPANVELLQAYGALLLRTGNTADARAVLERARAADPAHLLVRVDLATVYRSQGDLEAAAAEAAEAVRLHPRAAEAHVAAGLVAGAAGREDEAGRHFRAALERRADHPDALFYLASVELRAGRPAAAVPLLEKLLASAPAYPEGQRLLNLAREMSSKPAS